MKHRTKKIVLILVRVKFFIDATIPFQSLGDNYVEMKNPDKKVNVEAFRDAKKLYLGGGVAHLFIRE